MLRKPFVNKEERDKIINLYNVTRQKCSSLEDDEDFEEADKLNIVCRQLDKEYHEKLPLVTMGCCPWCGIPFVHTFDPYGLDGFWWESGAVTDHLEPPSCPHFCVLKGALDLNGKPPWSGNLKVSSGPPVPYVIPEILELDGMTAVISRVDMKNGYITYPITYFAEKKPHAEKLTGEWRINTYYFEDEQGNNAWMPTEYENWDFELRPWLEKGKIRWCDPGTDNTRLSTAPSEKCPYIDLPGERRRYRIWKDEEKNIGLPG